MPHHLSPHTRHHLKGTLSDLFDTLVLDHTIPSTGFLMLSIADDQHVHAITVDDAGEGEDCRFSFRTYPVPSCDDGGPYPDDDPTPSTDPTPLPALPTD